jgi:predicted lipoprotein with Yx(FWY)xxD motif
MTTRHNWKWLTMFAVAVLALGAVFAAACGDDDDDGDDNGDTTPVAQATQPAAEETEPAAEETEPAATETEPAAGGGAAALDTSEDAALGTIIVDGEGMTLYTFTNDTADSGESACYDACASAWPPLTTDGEPTAGDGVTGTIATIERTDGTTQVTYNGMPLYYFASDSAPGDTTGHEVGGVWFVATP